MRNLSILAVAFGLATTARADDAREMDVDKLHEATGTTSRQIFCTYSAARKGPGFTQNASASVSGNRSLESLLDDACQQCLANRLPCKLEKLLLVEYDSMKREQTDSQITLDDDVDVSCPRKDEKKTRVANGAKAKLTDIPPPKRGAVRAPLPEPFPNPWATPGFFSPFGPAMDPYQHEAFQNYEARQREAFHWFRHRQTAPRPPGRTS